MPIIRVVKMRVGDKLEIRRLLDVPVERAQDFVRAPYEVLPNVASVPIGAIHPYFGERRQAKVREIMKSCWFENPIDPTRILESVPDAFADTFYAHLLPDPMARRYVHLDIGITVDAAGMAMGHLSTMMADPNALATTTPRFMRRPRPKIVIDFAVAFSARELGEIEIRLLADIIHELDRRGFVLELVTCDQAQSRHMIQELRRSGYTVAVLSIDRTAYAIIIDPTEKDLGYRKESTEGQYAAAMAALRDLIDADDAFLVPDVPILLTEIGSANFEPQRQKVDHTAGGSIDVLQSVAGVCFNIVNNEDVASLLVKQVQARQVPLVADIDASQIDDTFYTDLRRDGEQVLVPAPETLDTDDIYDSEEEFFEILR